MHNKFWKAQMLYRKLIYERFPKNTNVITNRYNERLLILLVTVEQLLKWNAYMQSLVSLLMTITIQRFDINGKAQSHSHRKWRLLPMWSRTDHLYKTTMGYYYDCGPSLIMKWQQFFYVITIVFSLLLSYMRIRYQLIFLTQFSMGVTRF